MNHFKSKHIKRGFLILLAAALLVLLLSCAVSAKTKTKEPVSDWSIPQYGEKAWNAFTAAINGLDTVSGTWPEISSGAGIVIDAQSGQAVYILNPDERRYPASMTKLMTLVVALDALNNGEVKNEDIVTYTAEAVALDGTRTGNIEGVGDTFQHTLEMMTVFSANDAAYVVALHVSGSIPAFAERMNKKAAELGMTNTHFVNPNGLHDDNHWTTARDMAVLCRYIIGREDCMAYCSLDRTVAPNGKIVYNTNKLLFWTQGADGLKTGTTEMAGHCLAATASRNGMRLIAVTMGSKSEYGHYIDSALLLEYGFANYSTAVAVKKGTDMGKVDVLYGREKNVSVAAAEDISYIIPNNQSADPKIEVNVTESLEGPAGVGTKAGEIIVTVNGNEVGRCDLVTTEQIHKRGPIRWLMDFFSQLFHGI